MIVGDGDSVLGCVHAGFVSEDGDGCPSDSEGICGKYNTDSAVIWAAWSVTRNGPGDAEILWMGPKSGM